MMCALLLLMVAFWSGNYIAGKIALREMPPLLLAGLRIGLAGVLMAPIYAASRRPVYARGAVRKLALLGIFGVTLNQVFFLVGLSRTSVAHAAILIGLTPIQVLLLACWRGQERMTTAQAMGMLVALAGVALLKGFESPNAAGTTWLGDLIVLLGGLAFAIFTVFGKEMTTQYSAVTMNTFGYVGGALALAPVTLWHAARHALANITTGAWLAVVYMALFPSLIAYLIYYYALTHIAASRVSALSYLQPVFATAMGVAILGEPVSLLVIAGGLVILSGVYLAERG